MGEDEAVYRKELAAHQAQCERALERITSLEERLAPDRDALPRAVRNRLAELRAAATEGRSPTEWRATEEAIEAWEKELSETVQCAPELMAVQAPSPSRAKLVVALAGALAAMGVAAVAALAPATKLEGKLLLDCERSLGCWIEGRCTLTANKAGRGQCGATTVAQCERSLLCELGGSCYPDLEGGCFDRCASWTYMLDGQLDAPTVLCPSRNPAPPPPPTASTEPRTPR